MGLNYDKHKGHQNQDSMWTSYSDLFLGLSVIFLLLYVSASLRQGTEGIRQVLENRELAKHNQDLQQQIKVYNTLKQQYLDAQATEDEQKTYENLMGKLELLQDEARDEKNKLREAAAENEKKEKALNQYQQVVRNIINANMIAKARIKNRDVMIDEKDETISVQTTEIVGLEKQVQQKKNLIEQGERKIASLETNLDQKMKALKAAYNSHKISEKNFQAQKAALKKQTEEQVALLKQKNNSVEAELAKINQELGQTTQKLQQTEGQLSKVSTEKTQLKSELESAKGRHQAEMAKLKGDFEAQAANERAAFQAQLAKEKLSGAERARREAAFRAEADRKGRELASKLNDLEGKFQATQGDLEKTRGGLAKAQGDLEKTKGDLVRVSDDLAKARENLEAKKRIADSIKKSFAAKGVKADVDPNSGDVMLSFGNEYFDTGNAKLKPKMREVLESAMPAYSKSLFENPKISEKISSVEIVGFASPTYKGKYVDPTTLSSNDRQAVNYNLDLSYQRARAIFDHMYSNMNFEHKKQLLPLVKVTGRSFLSNDRNVANNGSFTEEFCRKNDCAKLQRVIIKFNLKD